MKDNKKIISLGMVVLLFFLCFLVIIGTSKISLLMNKEKVEVAENFIRDSFTFKMNEDFLTKDEYLKQHQKLKFTAEYSNAQRKLFDKYNIYNRSTAYSNSTITPFPKYSFIEWEVKNLKIKSINNEIITYDITLNTSKTYDPSNSGDVTALFNTIQERNKISFNDLTLKIQKEGDDYSFEMPKEVDSIVNEYNLTWQKRGNIDE